MRRTALLMLFLGLGLVSLAAGAPIEKSDGTLTAQRLESTWADLIQHDDEGSRQAHLDMQQMIGSPALVVPFLRDRLKPAGAPDRAAIAKAIAELDSNDFSTREAATKQLEAIGPAALPLLEQKLQEKGVPLEMRNRLQRLTEMGQSAADKGLSADELRALRAVLVLQEIGTPEARAVLEALAKGGEASALTVTARRALRSIASGKE